MNEFEKIHNDVKYKSKLAPSIFTAEKLIFGIEKVSTKYHKCYKLFCRFGSRGEDFNCRCVDLTRSKLKNFIIIKS